MLGVLKRRWKPKRSSNGSSTKIPNSDTNSLDSFDRDKSYTNRSHHQVHPVLDSQAFLGYDKPPFIETTTNGTTAATGGGNNIPRTITPPPSIIPQLQSAPAPAQCASYPLAPNICVEAGRIQFIRSSAPDGATDGIDPHLVAPNGRITVTRGLQTDQVDGFEQFRHIQLSLEARIAELETALELAQRNELRDKQTISKLQKSLSKRESAHRDADRERRLRADSETRAKQALQEASRCRSRLKMLTNEFARMEDTVRSMLMYKKQADQLKQEKTALTLAFENRCKQYQATISRLNIEISSLRQQLDQVGQDNCCNGIGLNAHTVALQKYAEESRKQYERCLDDVANQVVRALLAQKGLKEEVGVLNSKIQELETQNRALTLMLLHQLRAGENDVIAPIVDLENVDVKKEGNNNNNNILNATNNNNQNINNNLNKTKEASISCNSSNKTSPVIMHTSLTMKHCNSFNSEFLEGGGGGQCDCSPAVNEKRLSADSSTIIETRLSLEDKKRHQVLTKLWTELKGTEVTPKKLLEALSAVDSSLWVPPKRPISLNLQLPIQMKPRPPLLVDQSGSKSEEDQTGNDESPESGNRDEGYSTMSSDVQADTTRGSGDATLSRKHDLEDLKEASDETDIDTTTRLLVTDSKDPDILYIPLNLLNLKQRNSFPPGKDVLPFQHIMRSFSDSHLCIKITAAPITPCYTFSSPISSSPSFLLFDLSTDKGLKRVAKGPNILVEFEGEEINQSPISWSSDKLECPSWDAEYIQQWLKLDETRSALQQHHRDLLELEYDRSELEDWSLSLSNDDLRDHWKNTTTTPSQISVSTLPSIQENNQLELEEDSNECLWNNSSYMADKEGRELITLLMDENRSKQWPYADQNSPDQNSWSSGSDDCSKRSSTALSDDTGELPGTDFTRDFYRLVKFESTKSLASISSINDNNLQSVLTFIAEQQKYIEEPPLEDNNSESSTRPCSLTEDITKDFNIEGPPPSDSKIDIKSSDSENYVTLKQLCEEFNQKNQTEENVKKIDTESIPQIAYANEICLVTPLDVESENCSAISEHPVDICSSINVELSDDQNDESKTDLTDSFTNGSESLTTSSISTSETIVSKIPLRKNSKSRLPISPSKATVNNNNSCSKQTKIPKSKYSRITSSSSAKPKLKKIVHVHQNPPATHLITSEKLPQCSSAIISNIIEGPPHRAVSFHERATSKDVIEELNRMIKNGEETNHTTDTEGVKLDQACRPTGWIHVEKDVDLTDPKARANLLDVMMASVSSDSSPTSSCGGSIASDSTEDPPDYGQLHRIHKFHRQKKASTSAPCTPLTETTV